MITLTNGQTTQEGTVICGTMRLEDLIPTFLDELERLQLPSVEQRALWDNISYYVETGNGQASTVAQSEEWAVDLLDELFDMLDSIAPDGYYFGAHPGDGCDYGWWQYEDNDNG